MSPQILMLANELREFLFAKVYNSKLANKDKMRAREVIYLLYEYFSGHTEALPSEYNLRNDDIARRVTDYIAGMTDHYAMYKAEEITTGKKITLSLFP